MLSLEPQERSRQQVMFLMDYFKDNPFVVKEAARARVPQTMFNLFMHMFMEEFKAGETVFRFGDRGQLFYIVLDGEVEIKTPAPVELEGQQVTPEGLVVFCISYFDEIFWEKIPNGEKVQNIIMDEVEELGIHVVNMTFDKKQALKHIDFEIASGTTQLPKQIENLLNPTKKQTLTLTWFKTVQRLGPGASFGERALLKNEERAATIVCSKDTTFATLHRKDYTNIIGAAQKKELKEKVEFLRGFRMFSQLRTNVIERIQYYMKTKHFIRGQRVYTENLSHVDGVYFITQGEFEVS